MSMQPWDKAYFHQAFAACRQVTLGLVENRQVEDSQSSLLKQQAHPDFSPVGWHLGHIAYTESLWMAENLQGLSCPFPQYSKLFAADGLPKSERENLPDLQEILAYLEEVRSQTLQTLSLIDLSTHSALLHWLLQHESQHIETIAMVLALHELHGSVNQPESRLSLVENAPPHLVDEMIYIPPGEFVQGCSEPFAIDNEKPAHRIQLNGYWLDRRPLSCSQYRQFIDAGGYQRAQWWTPAGWQWQQSAKVKAPLYWPQQTAERDRPVYGVSWYEADAYARFVGKRLPTESEWTKAAHSAPDCENMLGSVWQWTDSWFQAYPGFRPFPYAGYSQLYFDQAHRVLRGGSFATPQWALRKSVRNWYHPHRREMFAGFRCAASERKD
ncbi:MAG: SUMF1/EgtB/PvdO family nonheme iron enzyme [Phormidesmis sp.]